MPIELSAASLPEISERAAVPHYTQADLTAGIVHFGVGNFLPGQQLEGQALQMAVYARRSPGYETELPLEGQWGALRVRGRLEAVYDKLTGAALAAPRARASAGGGDAGDNGAGGGAGGGGDDASPSSRSSTPEPDGVLDAATSGVDPAEDADDVALANKLWCLYYVKEMYDCECAWPATAAAVANDVRRDGGGGAADAAAARPAAAAAAPASPSGAAPSGASVAVVPGVKNALLARLTPADEAIARLPHMWNMPTVIGPSNVMLPAMVGWSGSAASTTATPSTDVDA